MEEAALFTCFLSLRWGFENTRYRKTQFFAHALTYTQIKIAFYDDGISDCRFDLLNAVLFLYSSAACAVWTYLHRQNCKLKKLWLCRISASMQSFY